MRRPDRRWWHGGHPSAFVGAGPVPVDTDLVRRAEPQFAAAPATLLALCASGRATAPWGSRRPVPRISKPLVARRFKHLVPLAGTSTAGSVPGIEANNEPTYLTTLRIGGRDVILADAASLT